MTLGNEDGILLTGLMSQGRGREANFVSSFNSIIVIFFLLFLVVDMRIQLSGHLSHFCISKESSMYHSFEVLTFSVGAILEYIGYNHWYKSSFLRPSWSKAVTRSSQII